MKHNTSRIWHPIFFVSLLTPLALKSSQQESSPLTPVRPMGSGNMTSESRKGTPTHQIFQPPSQPELNLHDRHSPNPQTLEHQTSINHLAHIMPSAIERPDLYQWKALTRKEIVSSCVQALKHLARAEQHAARTRELTAKALNCLVRSNPKPSSRRRRESHASADRSYYSQGSRNELSRLSPLQPVQHQPNGHSTSPAHPRLSKRALETLNGLTQSPYIRRTSTQKKPTQQPRHSHIPTAPHHRHRRTRHLQNGQASSKHPIHPYQPELQPRLPSPYHDQRPY